jgi:hypothetical protein
VVATHGRSFWILDDVTPLRQLAPAMQTQEAVLFKPQTAVRLNYPDEVNTRRPVGENPPAGALIDYYFRAKPEGEVTVDVVDAQGKLMRHLSSTKTGKEVQPPEWPDRIVPTDLIPAQAGMNRLVWDLRMSDPEQIPGAFYSGSTPRGPRVVPGKYTVSLSVNGKKFDQPITVVADPRAAENLAAIRAKTELLLAAEHDIDRLHHAVNAIRKTREQFAKTKASLSGRDALASEAAALATALDPIEEALTQVNMKGSEANLAFPGMLNELFASFAASQEDADTPPTTQHLAIFKDLHAKLNQQLANWDQLSRRVAEFDSKLKKQGVAVVGSGVAQGQKGR